MYIVLLSYKLCGVLLPRVYIHVCTVHMYNVCGISFVGLDLWIRYKK